jgi:hypothetical protein
MRLRELAPTLRYAGYVLVALLAFFAAVGVGAAASLVVGWQPERVATGSGGPTGSGMPKGTTSETTDADRLSEGTAIETTKGAEDAQAGGSSYVHIATDGNSRGDYTYLSHPAVDGDPSAVVLVEPAPDLGSAGGAAYAHNIGVWYEPGAKKWAIFNQDREAVPVGTAFRVVVPRESEGFVERLASAPAGANGTYLDDPLVNDNPEAVLSVTQNWNPGGGVGVYNDHPVGLDYDGERGR